MKRVVFIWLICSGITVGISPGQQDRFQRERQARELAEQLLAGREILVRVYNDWQTDPRSYDLVSVKLDGLSVSLDSAKSVSPRMSDSAIIVVIADDQTDEAVATVVGDFVDSAIYEQRRCFYLLSPYFIRSKRSYWTFNDPLGNPIAEATIEVFLYEYNGPQVFIGTFVLDEQGRWNASQPIGKLNQFHFRVVHPEYGIAPVRRLMAESKDIAVPLVRPGTKASQRAIWGFVADPEGRPVSGASIECGKIRTLGEGLITSLHGHPFKVFTDEQGRFRMYLPNQRRSDDRGELIPPKSRYCVRIDAPRALGLLPYTGEIFNGQETTITLGRGEHFRTFVFHDADGQVIQPEKLKKIQIVVERKGQDPLHLTYSDWKDGGMFPEGTYKARIWQVGAQSQFEPLQVTAHSPAQLVFTLRQGILYFGQVVHGITQEPMPGAFVIAEQGSRSGNLSQITSEQWQAMHAVSEKPSASDSALEPVQRIYCFNQVVRTDAQGRFQMYFEPEQDFYGFLAFEENYLGVLYRKHTLRPDANRPAEVPAMPLFPAAKVAVELCVEAQHLAVMPSFLIDPDNNPPWTGRLLATDNNRQSSLTYRRWLTANEPQAFHVPAGVNLQIKLDTPYDRSWCPFNLDQTISLQQGQVLDLGRLVFEKAVTVAVKILNSAGEPMEGIPVYVLVNGRMWTTAHITDENGVANFHVPPYSQGQFLVRHEDPSTGKFLKKTTAYQAGDRESPGREFTLQLSDEMLHQLFK